MRAARLLVAICATATIATAANAQSLDWQKDMWHVPQFFELLTQQQDQYDLAITGKQDAKTTLDNIAKFQENLLTEAGLIQK